MITAKEAKQNSYEAQIKIRKKEIKEEQKKATTSPNCFEELAISFIGANISNLSKKGSNRYLPPKFLMTPYVIDYLRKMQYEVHQDHFLKSWVVCWY